MPNKKWRILRDRCNRRWYYVRTPETTYGTPALKGDPMEFDTREEAIAHAESLYRRFQSWWRTWAELSVILESPEGVRTKHWLEPPEVIATVQRKDPY
jgi:hypothetical protein